MWKTIGRRKDGGIEQGEIVVVIDELHYPEFYFEIRTQGDRLIVDIIKADSFKRIGGGSVPQSITRE